MTTTTTTATVTLTLTADQARLVHAALSDATNVCRDQELHWLNQHEALAEKAPVTSGEAWQTFKAWERRETLAVQAIDAIRASSVELRFSDHGIARR